MPDSSFGLNGITLTEINYTAFCADAILDADGKIILTGYSVPAGTDAEFVITRYNNDVNVGIDNGNENDLVPILNQNDPNPFYATTRIVYSLPIASHVYLKVFDPLGHQVAVLVDGEESPGIKMVYFDASKIGSGIYFYSLKWSDHFETRRMIVQK